MKKQEILENNHGEPIDNRREEMMNEVVEIAAKVDEEYELKIVKYCWRMTGDRK